MTNTAFEPVDNRTDEHRSTTPSRSRSSCPECDGKVVHDDRGERMCEDCGLVVDDDTIDHGPEWRAFDSDERDEKRRVGMPMTQLMHDKGLSATIGWQDTDGYGRSITGRKRAKLRRLRRWDERFQTKNARERNLKQAFGEIKRMAAALGLPAPVGETAGVLYRRAIEDDLLPGRSIEGMSTASLYAAARQHDTPRTLPEFATVSRVERLRIQRAYRYLSRELGLGIEPTDPIQYVPQFASELDVSDEATRRARDLLTTAKTRDIHSGRSPAGLAAGALYAATRLTNERLTQGTVNDVTHVSRVTIRNRYRELLDIYAAAGNNA